MKRVYIAGKYRGETIIDILNNMHDGIKKCAELLETGEIAPFCPWIDYQFQFFNKNLKVEHYLNYSIAWLEVADEMWVLPNSENSKGTQIEIQRANELNIPITYLK